jgi:hypothetical protein
MFSKRLLRIPEFNFTTLLIRLAGFIIPLFMLTVCSTDKPGLTVICNIENTDGRTIYFLEQDVIDLMKLDSLTPAAGEKVIFRKPIQETGIYLIRAEQQKQVVFIASPGDTIIINRDIQPLSGSFRACGNRETEALQEFYRMSDKNRQAVDSLQRIIEEHQDDPDFYEQTLSLDSSFQRIWQTQREYEQAFIDLHPNFLASLLVLNYHFGVKPVLSPETDIGYYRKVDSGLMASCPENKHTKFFHAWLNERTNSGRTEKRK